MLTAILFAASTIAAPIPLDEAHRVFHEIRLASDEEGGRLWGVPLYGPMLLVDPATRFAVANQQDGGNQLTQSGRVFTGTLPASVILANTAVDWSGTRWTMVLWPALGDRSVPRRRLLFHEAWHRIQDSIGFPATETPLAELDSLEGRYWLRLELRALAAALRSEGTDRKTAIEDALTFRARRRTVLPAVTDGERALEANEGLAEYTGFALRGTTDVESRHALSRRLDALDADTAFSRSFAYHTGPAYGLLLDQDSPGWTKRMKATSHLGALLVAAAGVTARIDEAEARAARYGAADLLAFEGARDAARREAVARNRALYVDGPILELPMANATFGFDPNRVTTLEGVGSIHERLDVRADWGTLAATSGALMAEDFTRIVVPATAGLDPAAIPVTGNGWVLTLAPGWSVVPAGKQGNWRVAATSNRSQPQ